MCGIAGLVDSLQPLGVAAEAHVRRMNRGLAHRGPDSEGLQVLSHAVLGHRRLAVIDLSPAGHQPMANEDRSVWVVFNGEIYNHRELRDELERAGHRYASRSDTETLVHGYEQWGWAGLLSRLRGMFAIALWDDRRRRLHLARDRHGVKPLYFWRQGSQVAFASEVRELHAFACPSVDSINPAALDYYLTFGHTPPDAGLLRSFQKLAPAHSIWFGPDGTEEDCYWSLDDIRPDGGSAHEIIAQLEGALDEAVSCRLESDVPMGCFLSGGIDSGLVAAHAASHLAQGLNTITVAFAGQPANDERALARLVARRYRTNHREEEIGAEAIGELPRLIALAGEPFADHSLLPTARVCRAARRSMTVALTGDGGDELFAGYYRVVAAYLGGHATHVLGRPLAVRTSRWLRPWGEAAHRISTALNYGTAGLVDLYAETGAVFSSERRQALYQQEWTGRLGAASGRQWVEKMAAKVAHLSTADAYARLDLGLRLPGDYLTKVDIASNASALECRSPFLDHRLAELVARIPMSSKLPWGRQKGLLRNISRRSLPPDVVNARKRGFGGNVGLWLKQQEPLIRNWLATPSLCQPGGPLRPEAVERMLREHFTGAADHGEQLWLIVCLEVWWRIFIEGSLQLTADFEEAGG